MYLPNLSDMRNQKNLFSINIILVSRTLPQSETLLLVDISPLLPEPAAGPHRDPHSSETRQCAAGFPRFDDGSRLPAKRAAYSLCRGSPVSRARSDARDSQIVQMSIIV